jgi:hypothetical protein
VSVSEGAGGVGARFVAVIPRGADADGADGADADGDDGADGLDANR